MKQALQAIEIAANPKIRFDVILGNKKITIREGHRDYHPGPVVLFSHIFPWAMKATITSVRHTTVGEVTEEEFWADSYENRVEMLADLRQFYPELTMKSPVTVICWEISNEGFYKDIDNVYAFAEENGLDTTGI